MQTRRCVMKFCQYDKISSRTFMFNDEEILQTGQDFNSNWNFGAKLLFLPSRVTHK